MFTIERAGRLHKALTVSTDDGDIKPSGWKRLKIVGKGYIHKLLILKSAVPILLVLGSIIMAPDGFADSVTEPVTIATSTAVDRPTLGIPRWKGYMHEADPNRFWATYTNGGRTRSQISYTTDGGGTWSTEPIQIDPDGYLDMHCSVFGRDGNLYATWPGRQTVTFRKFSFPAEGNDDAGPLVPIAGTDGYYRSNITVQDNDRIWLFTRLSYDDPSENVLFNYSDNDGADWVHGTAYATNHNSVRFGSMPYVNGSPALIVLYLNDPRGFEYYLWNGTSFEAKPDHSIYPGNVRNSRAFTHNVIRDTTFHLVFAVGNVLHHVWKNFNNGTGSWNHQIVENSDYTSDMDWSPMSTVRGDDLFLFYARKASSAASSSMIYERKWSQRTQTWTEPLLVSTDGTGEYDRDPNTCFQVPESSPYIPVYWTRGNGPFDIVFSKIMVDNGASLFVDCPSDTVVLNACNGPDVCMPLDISNASEVTVDGATWDSGTLCLHADTAGVYTPVITATGVDDTVTCSFPIRVNSDPDVTIVCPTDEFIFTNCGSTTFQLNLPITNQSQVSVPGATWSGNRLYFFADTSGAYTFMVTASNTCDVETCQVTAAVTILPDVDLNLSDGDITVSNLEAAVGDTVTIFAAVNNVSGSLTAANVHVRFYDGEPSSGGAPIGSDRIIASLSGGSTRTVSVLYTIEGPTPREIHVLVDPDNQIGECAENNNAGMMIIEGSESSSAVDGSVSFSGSGLQGITVNLLDHNGNDFLAAITDDAGYYRFDSVSAGQYIVDLDVPFGFGVSGNSSVPINLNGSSVQVNFILTDETSGDVSNFWWWKKQIQGLNDNTELYSGLTITDMDWYGQSIFEHFYQRPDSFAIMIEDVTYKGNPAIPLGFEDFARIWLDTHDDSNPARIRRHLLTCLLNVASARLDQMAIVSEDGASVSQAITYFAGQYMNGNSNDWTIWYYIGNINGEVMVDGGVIPLSTPEIIYKADDGSGEVLPARYELSQNSPNPFNAGTTIEFSLSQPAVVSLEIYNVAGQKVDNIQSGYKPAGTYSVKWEGNACASGIYFYRLVADGKFIESRKMVLLK